MNTYLKRLLPLCAALVLLCAGALAESRYDQVYDTSGDAGSLTVRFVWLGKQVADDKPGDCMILTSPEGKVMVLDAGHPEAWPYVKAALECLGVERIDYLVASHPHIDHIGNFDKLLTGYEIGALYTSPVAYESSRYYRACMEAVVQTGVEHIVLAEGDSFDFGESVRVDVYNPERDIVYPKDYPTGSTQFINNNSLVLKFTYGEASLVLAGDLYVAGEKEVAGKYGDLLACDVTKPNHHGSSTSSSKTWRDALSAKLAFITSDTVEDLSIARKWNKNGCTMYHILVDGDLRVRLAQDARYDVLSALDRETDLFD